jgi:phage terminase large subunit-like protein
MIKLSARTKRNIDWIHEHIYVPEGRLVGQRVKLSPAQIQWMEDIYGTKTRTFILSIPRKNGKTAFSAMIVLLHLVGPEAVFNGQLYSTANSKDQASVLFNLAARIVRLSPTLQEHVGIRDTNKHLYCNELGTVYKALSADSTTAMGMSPVLHISDESGQVRGPRNDLYEALETASAAQINPLTIVISTQAATDGDFLSVMIDDALTGADPTIKCRVYQVAKDDDPFDEEVLAKAQPNWHLMNHEEVFKMARDAKRMPSKEAGFRNLVANQRVEASNPFVSRSTWLENGEQPEELEGLRVWGGLDLSSVSDLTALVLVSEHGDVHSRFWLPQDGLVEKSRSDRVPYDIWESEGYLLTTPGRSIEYDFIAHELRDLFDICDVQSIAFDRYNMKFLKPCLERAGFSEEELEKFVEFGQGFVSMSPAIRELESKLLQKQLKHGNHPVLTMCAANAITVNDPAGNRKFTKQKSTGRIDGMQALAQAVGIMPQLAEAGDFDGFLMNPVAV